MRQEAMESTQCSACAIAHSPDVAHIGENNVGQAAARLHVLHQLMITKHTNSSRRWRRRNAALEAASRTSVAKAAKGQQLGNPTRNDKQTACRGNTQKRAWKAHLAGDEVPGERHLPLHVERSAVRRARQPRLGVPVQGDIQTDNRAQGRTTRMRILTRYTAWSERTGNRRMNARLRTRAGSCGPRAHTPTPAQTIRR